MKRLLWLGLGVVVGVCATRASGAAGQRLDASGFGADLADGLRELGAGLGAFGAEVRAGMVARERELNDLVLRGSGGHIPTIAEALTDTSSTTPRRARRAGA